MKQYQIHIDKDAFADIKYAAAWYNEQQVGLGAKFIKQTKTQITSLKTNPLKCSVRYSNIRCLLVKKFPFLIHYSVDELNNIVEIFAVIHTSRNPKIWEQKTIKK
jgi:hypothetical protein